MKASTVNRINRRMSVAFSCVVLLFGILFLTFAIKNAAREIPENYVETQARITRIEEEPLPGADYGEDGLTSAQYDYHVFVRYTYGDSTYVEVEYGSYDSTMEVGGTVLLYVNPDNPTEFISDPSGDCIFVIIGAVIALGGLGGIAYQIYQKKKEC